VYETVLATRQANRLRSRRREAYQAFLDDLARRGCAALDYRVTGPDPLARLCVRHLRGNDRVVVAFGTADDAWVVLVGEHDETDPGIDVYSTLYELAGAQPSPSQSRNKPPCCDDDNGNPPVANAEIIDDLVHRARQIARQVT
jgi:hypothetical protein